MSMPSRSLILAEPVDIEATKKRLWDVFQSWRDVSDLSFVFDETRPEDQGVVVDVWWAPTQEIPLDIRLVDDRVADTRYLSVVTDDEDRSRDLVARLADEFPTVSISDLLEQARSPQPGPHALMRLGLGLSGEPSEEAVSLIRDGLDSPQDATRDDAAEAAAVYRRPELVPDLEAALAGETDPVRRQKLDVALQLSRPSTSGEAE